jgi:CopG antitoxin of type II toxin-antitoxin system
VIRPAARKAGLPVSLPNKLLTSAGLSRLSVVLEIECQCPIPEEFASYEEAAEFWDTHDTTDYPDAFRTVELETDLRRRRYEIEIEEDVIKKLRAQARRRGISPRHLVLLFAITVT